MMTATRRAEAIEEARDELGWREDIVQGAAADLATHREEIAEFMARMAEELAELRAIEAEFLAELEQQQAQERKARAELERLTA